MGTRIEAYVHASTPVEQPESTIRRLERVESGGGIDGFEVHVWEKEVSLSYGDEATTAFEEFERWAERNGKSIRPPFDVRDRGSYLTDSEDRVLVTPVVCLAVYEGDEITGVYPCSDDETRTVDDFVSDLESGVDARLTTA